MTSDVVAYCRFVRAVLTGKPGDIINIPAGMTRAEVDGVLRRKYPYYDWMAN